jgi:hypothetical protein
MRQITSARSTYSQEARAPGSKPGPTRLQLKVGAGVTGQFVGNSCATRCAYQLLSRNSGLTEVLLSDMLRSQVPCEADGIYLLWR